jgi:hypothetical protein
MRSNGAIVDEQGKLNNFAIEPKCMSKPILVLALLPTLKPSMDVWQ